MHDEGFITLITLFMELIIIKSMSQICEGSPIFTK